MLEQTLETPLDSKEIKSVKPKGNQPWIFIERTDAEAETLILRPHDAKNRLVGKDPDAGKDWRQEKGMIEDEIVHRLNGHEFEQALGVGDGQESLVCCGPWGRKESDTTEWLIWTELKLMTSSSEPRALNLVRLIYWRQLLTAGGCVLGRAFPSASWLLACILSYSWYICIFLSLLPNCPHSAELVTTSTDQAKKEKKTKKIVPLFWDLNDF